MKVVIDDLAEKDGRVNLVWGKFSKSFGSREEFLQWVNAASELSPEQAIALSCKANMPAAPEKLQTAEVAVAIKGAGFDLAKTEFVAAEAKPVDAEPVNGVVQK